MVSPPEIESDLRVSSALGATSPTIEKPKPAQSHFLWGGNRTNAVWIRAIAVAHTVFSGASP